MVISSIVNIVTLSSANRPPRQADERVAQFWCNLSPFRINTYEQGEGGTVNLEAYIRDSPLVLQGEFQTAQAALQSMELS
jgi:hypothetical protein